MEQLLLSYDPQETQEGILKKEFHKLREQCEKLENLNLQKSGSLPNSVSFKK